MSSEKNPFSGLSLSADARSSLLHGLGGLGSLGGLGCCRGLLGGGGLLGLLNLLGSAERKTTTLKFIYCCGWYDSWNHCLVNPKD